MNTSSICEVLKNDGIVVLRTDTIYGVVALATSKKAVEKVYSVKNRAANKQCIVLISDPNSVPVHAEMIDFYTTLNEEPTSIVVPVSDEPSWITRDGKDVAYRLVRDGLVKEIIDAVGPLLAPSANPEGEPPARSIAEAKAYFGDSVDLYVDGGEVPEATHASRIIRINQDGSVEHIR